MRLSAALALTLVAVTALPSIGSAQTWGQPYGRAQVTTYGQPYGPSPAYAPPITEWDTRAYVATGRAATGYGSGYSAYGSQDVRGQRFGNPYAYWPPVGRRGYRARYGDGGYHQQYTAAWSRWSSPPGRGYHDVYGYNDDRAPRGRDCYCGVGPYLYDR